MRHKSQPSKVYLMQAKSNDHLEREPTNVFFFERFFSFWNRFLWYSRAKNTWSRCIKTILSTSGAVTWSKYDIGQSNAAASTISATRGWVRAAKDMIVPCRKKLKKFSLLIRKRGPDPLFSSRRTMTWECPTRKILEFASEYIYWTISAKSYIAKSCQLQSQNSCI